MAISMQLWNRSSASSSLATNFGAASGVVIAGVLLAWIALKLDVKPVELPAAENVPSVETDTSVQVSASAAPSSDTLIEQAETAFAAGRIVEPDYDNALGYYLAALDEDPKNEAALAGIDRVV